MKEVILHPRGSDFGLKLHINHTIARSIGVLGSTVLEYPVTSCDGPYNKFLRQLFFDIFFEVIDRDDSIFRHAFIQLTHGIGSDHCFP